MPFSDNLIIIAYSFLPASLLALYFWWLDRFTRQPLIWVLLTFFWGAFVSGLFSYFINTVFLIGLGVYHSADPDTNLVNSVVIAPFIEEFCKAVFLLVLFSTKRLYNVTDGLLYGIVIGLGFASAENISYARRIYVLSGELAMWNNLWIREVSTTLLHAASSAVFGAMLGAARFVPRNLRLFLIANGFILSCAAHGFWNFLAKYSGTGEGEVDLIETIMPIYLVILSGAILSYYLNTVRQESAMIRRELEEESRFGTLPAAHVGFMAALVRRTGDIRLATGAKPRAYARTGEWLAFKKQQSRVTPSQALADDIESLRATLRAMSGGPHGV